tara:strand:+ start:1821 stop:2582 length:762 start_codon:yes stop_codon:yes gene_type:complete
MPTKIIIRFDDICPTMNWDIFLFIKEKLHQLGIKSILGVIPNNKDKLLSNHKNQDEFFEKINSYKKYGDTIAQHGTHHKYTSASSGILKINNRSEFAGHDYKYQYELIKKGKKILEDHNCWQPVFMAPSHSFDLNTLISLNKLGFTSITDGYGLYPYKKSGITLVPQLSSRPFNLGFGLATICIHSNYLNNEKVKRFLNFVSTNRSRIISYKEYQDIKVPPRFICKALELISYETIYGLRVLRKVNRNFKNAQ